MQHPWGAFDQVGHGAGLNKEVNIWLNVLDYRKVCFALVIQSNLHK